jgi:hypothetical protein
MSLKPPIKTRTNKQIEILHMNENQKCTSCYSMKRVNANSPDTLNDREKPLGS